MNWFRDFLKRLKNTALTMNRKKMWFIRSLTLYFPNKLEPTPEVELLRCKQTILEGSKYLTLSKMF